MSGVKVLFVVSSLDYSGVARSLAHLAAGLPRDRFAVRIAVLGTPTPWVDQLATAGVALDVLGWRRPFDLHPLLYLNRLVARELPAVVVAWGAKAAWALLPSGACRPGGMRLAEVLPPGRPGWALRWLLRHCGGVLALGRAEAERYRAAGVPAERLAVVPPGVPLPEHLPPPAQAPGLPVEARVILCPGPLGRHKGHRDAAWALDILRLVHPNVHLVISGEGPGTAAVRRLMDSSKLHDCVHLLGPVGDPGPWLARAEVVWVPALREGGRFAALEAMAAGRPVIASRLPGLAELVDPERTGRLTEPGDKVDLARQTRLLLDQPEQARQMGEAGRQRVREHFGLGAFLAGAADWLAR